MVLPIDGRVPLVNSEIKPFTATAFRNGEFGAAAATGWIMVAASLLIASFYLVKMHRRMVADHA